MSGHTPGPWVLHPTSTHPAVRSVGTPEVGPRRICTVGSMNGAPVDQHNARLIAAAPDLLAVADDLRAWWLADGISGNAALDDLVHRARLAVAKATGGKP